MGIEMGIGIGIGMGHERMHSIKTLYVGHITMVYKGRKKIKKRPVKSRSGIKQ